MVDKNETTEVTQTQSASNREIPTFHPCTQYKSQFQSTFSTKVSYFRLNKRGNFCLDLLFS